MSIEQRVVGSGAAALQVSAEGLGCMGMSQSCGPADEAESVATIHAALDTGTKRRSHLLENIGALAIVLSADDRRQIEEAAPKGSARGDRHPESMMQSINR